MSITVVAVLVLGFFILSVVGLLGWIRVTMSRAEKARRTDGQPRS